MIAINYNVISDFHWDEHDDPNSLCCLVALGDFERGEVLFPQLQIVVQLKPGQILVFASRLLLHGNLSFTRGIRHSIVYFVHSGFFHHLRDFTKIYDDSNDLIERDARGQVVSSIARQDLNVTQDREKHKNLKRNQKRVPPAPTDCRRRNMGMSLS
jgi:hypothetical protein